MHTTFIFARHTLPNTKGKIAGREPVALVDPEGKEQALRMGAFLYEQKIPIHAIVSTPVFRGWQTGDLLRRGYKQPKLPLVTHEGLTEVDAGDIQGIDAYEYFGMLRRLHIPDPYVTPKDFPQPGEKPREFIPRTLNALRDINKEYSGKTIVVISHLHPLLGVLWQIRNPNKEFDTFAALPKGEDDFGYGQVIRMVIDSNMNLIEESLLRNAEGVISPYEGKIIKKER